MPDLDDAALAKIELRQRRKAEALVKELWDFTEYPKIDAVGITRLGFGWPINEVPVTPAVAEIQVAERLSRIQDVLHFRAFEIVGMHPEAEDRLAYLYLVADIIGVEILRDMTELWGYVRAGDWEEVAIELDSLQWESRIQLTRDNKRKLKRITNRIQHGEPR